MVHSLEFVTKTRVYLGINQGNEQFYADFHQHYSYLYKAFIRTMMVQRMMRQKAFTYVVILCPKIAFDFLITFNFLIF